MRAYVWSSHYSTCAGLQTLIDFLISSRYFSRPIQALRNNMLSFDNLFIVLTLTELDTPRADLRRVA